MHLQNSILIFVINLFAANSAHSAPSSDVAGFTAWINEFRSTAISQGIRPEVYDQTMAGVTPDFALPDLEVQRVPKAEQAEFVKTPEQYLSGKQLLPLEIQGRKLLTVHKATFDNIDIKYGVDRHILLALWGRETAFGTFATKHNVIQALATQAYIGRRRDLFRKQLIAAFRLVQDGLIDAKTTRSSWAGAMGLMQFLPTDYYDHAVDADGDGKRDIWTSPQDALASLANTLKKLGWVSGQPWGVEVEATSHVDCSLANLDVTRTIKEWEASGVKALPGKPFNVSSTNWQASLLMPAGTLGPSFLTFQNFQVLREYNKSDLYALFVGHLADRLRGDGEFSGRWQPAVQIPSKEVTEMQKLLSALSYYKDTIDGKAGGRTRSALGRYQKLAGLSQTCWPTPEVIAHLKMNVPMATSENLQ